MTESSLATRLAHFFVSASSQHSFPAPIGIYSVVLGLFIPSAGGKWLRVAEPQPRGSGIRQVLQVDTLQAFDLR
jgi:short subunit fatty acids transporter